MAATVALEKASDERSAAMRPRSPSCASALDDIRRVAATDSAQKLIDDPDPIVEEAVDGCGRRDGAAADGPLAPEPVSAADAAARVGDGRASSSASRTRPIPRRT